MHIYQAPGNSFVVAPPRQRGKFRLNVAAPMLNIATLMHAAHRLVVKGTAVKSFLRLFTKQRHDDFSPVPPPPLLRLHDDSFCPLRAGANLGPAVCSSFRPALRWPCL